MTKNPIFGLDFGTSNTVLSVATPSNIQTLNIDPTAENPRTMKSVIFFDEEGQPSLVGEEAINMYLTYGGSYGRLMQSVKENLSQQNFIEANIFGKWLYVEEIIAIILREARTRGCKQIGSDVTSAVLGTPVTFSGDASADKTAQARLEKAAKLAGFTYVDFLYEPIAATLSYQSSLSAGDEKLVFMGDFGGGTSDFVAMKITGGVRISQSNQAEQILSVGGVHIGGDLFDSLIMKQKLWKKFGYKSTYKSATGQQLEMPNSYLEPLGNWRISSQLRSPKTLRELREVSRSSSDPKGLKLLEDIISKSLIYMVYRSIESAKRTLSSQAETSIAFSEEGVNFSEPLNVGEFQRIISAPLEELASKVDETLANSGLKASQFDAALLTGGTSYVPAVRKIFEDRFGAGKILALDPFTSVSHGLSVYGNTL